MSQHTTKQEIGQLKLDLLETKTVTVGFDGDDVSGNGGVVLPALVEKMSGLIKGAAACLEDHRTASMIKHNMVSLMQQRVFQIIAGFSAADGSDLARFDPMIKMAAGRDPLTGDDLASQPTQSRLETGRKGRELYALCNWLVDYYISCHPRPPKHITLYFDGSSFEVFGVQQQSFWRGGPYKKYMYFPLFVFDQNGWPLVAALRPGDDGEVALTLPVLKRLVRKLRAAWPKVRITVKGDAAFSHPDLYKWLDDNEVGYLLGLAENNALRTHSKDYCKTAEKRFKRRFENPKFLGKGARKRKNTEMHEIRSTTNQDERIGKQHAADARRVRVYGQFLYAARTWDRKRRIICRCDHTDDGRDVRYVVTNLSHPAPEAIYKLYCGRALVEMWIKHMKETEATRLSCAQFKSNMFRLLLHAFAYILLHQARLLLNQDRVMSIEQFRRHFINVAVLVHEAASSVRLTFARSYSHARQFRLIAKRLGAESLIAA